MINIIKQKENDLIEELEESKNIDCPIDFLEEEDCDNVNMYEKLIYCKDFNETIKFQKYYNYKNEYECVIPIMGDTILDACIDIYKCNIAPNEYDSFIENLLNTKILLVAGGDFLSDMDIPCNIYLSKLLGKHVFENDEKISIPVFSLYYLCKNFSNETKGFPIMNMCYSNLSIQLKTHIDAIKLFKLKIRMGYQDTEFIRETVCKNLRAYSIKSVCINSDDNQYINSLFTVPLCLLIKIEQDFCNMNIINICINDIDYSFNLLRGEIEELNIFGINYYIINIGSKNIKYVLKNIQNDDIKYFKNFKIDIDSSHGSNKITLLKVIELNLSSGCIYYK